MPVFEGASKPSATYQDWDPRYLEVVRSLIGAMGPFPTDVAIEHVGSTAIQGCGGKGVIDLLATYPDGAREETKVWLLSLGLSRQGAEFSRPWPESRPMYLGSYRYGGQAFMIYVHVVRQTSDEVRRFRAFRDLLRGRPDLIAEYCNLKREIILAGVADTDEYKARKRPFLHKVLGADHSLKDR